MSRKTRRREATTPVVGLLAAVALTVIVFVVVTAARGLPGSRPYTIAVAVPDAMRLAANSEVRIRGVRVGRISHVEVIRRDASAPPVARLTLELNRSAPAIRAGSEVAVRAAATLGATFLDLTPARAGRMVPEGGVLPFRPASSRSGSVTDLLDAFDAATRRGIRRASVDLSGAVAGRGTDVNQTFAETAVLLPDLQGLLATLGAPQTRTAQFLEGLAQVSSAIAGVGSSLSGALAGGATTFAALARSRDALGTTITRSPAAVGDTTVALTLLTPVLRDVQVLATTLRPVVRGLPGTARTLRSALRTGPSGLAALRAVLPELVRTGRALTRLSKRPSVEATRQKLDELVRDATPLADTLTAAQVHCNVIGLWADGLSASGYAVRGQTAVANLAQESFGAQGETIQNATPSPDLKNNFLPHLDASECESGNEPAGPGQVIGNPPGLQRASTRATRPPGDARARAERAGLLRTPRGAR